VEFRHRQRGKSNHRCRLIWLRTSHRSQDSPAHRHSNFSQNRRWSVPHFRVWHYHSKQSTAVQRSSQPIRGRTTTSPSNGKSGIPVLHHIVATGPPVAEEPRRLTGYRLTSPKAAFDYMLEQGICQPSSSPCASLLHLVSKKLGWRACGDYRKFNALTVPEFYPIAHIYDVADHLHGKTIFTTLDLVRAYHRIPMAKEEKKRSQHSIRTLRVCRDASRPKKCHANLPEIHGRYLQKLILRLLLHNMTLWLCQRLKNNTENSYASYFLC
jgi:hypothetical protein